MRIVLDMDGTLADFWGACAQRFGPGVPGKYNLSEGWPECVEAVHAFQADPQSYTDLPPYPGAVEAVQAMHAAGHELYVVTARGPEVAYWSATHTWLKRHGLSRCVKGVQSTHFDDKVTQVWMLAPDIVFDDSPFQVPLMRAKGLRVVVVDQDWNQGLNGERLRGWSNLTQFVNLEPLPMGDRP